MTLTKQNKGFSLIELIVVISIIAIFVSISVNVYKNLASERLFQEDVTLVMSILEQTKQRAIARDVSPSSTCVKFNNYSLLINPTNNTITQEFRCDRVRIRLDSYELKKSTINFPSTNKRLVFTTPYGNLNTTGNKIILRDDASGMCVKILIPQIGIVTANDPYSC